MCDDYAALAFLGALAPSGVPLPVAATVAPSAVRAVRPADDDQPTPTTLTQNPRAPPGVRCEALRESELRQAAL
jgi:hypothetical protein